MARILCLTLVAFINTESIQIETMLSPLSPFYAAHCLHCRLPASCCVCKALEHSALPFNIMICSHSKEWQKMDNTAHWAWLSSDSIHRLKWHRQVQRINSSLPLNSQPINAELLADISQLPGHYLLFPSEDTLDIDQHVQNIEQLWVVDGTWQEAEKMLRQSPWLDRIPKIKIPANHPALLAQSQFQLRRNQRGLSTIEAIAAALDVYLVNKDPTELLLRNFSRFQSTLLQLKK